MPSARITKEQIFEAADAMQARGDEPTVRKLYDELDAQGSYSTINKYFGQWRAERTVQAQTAPGMPEEIAQRCSQLGIAIWSRAAQLADERTVQALKQVSETQATLERCEQEITYLTEVNESQISRIATQDSMIAGLQADYDKATQRAQLAETRTTTLEQQVSDLRVELDRCRQELSEAQAARLEQARLSGEIASLERQNAALLAQLAKRQERQETHE